MNRRHFVKLATLIVVTPAVLAIDGCDDQNTIADLIAAVGPAVAAVVSLLGQTVLAQQLQQDTNLAVADVRNWKSGTSDQIVVEAMNLVLSDIGALSSFIPPEYQVLIGIAAAAVEAIIAILPVDSPVVASARVHSKAMSAVYPKMRNAKEFRKVWNAECFVNPKLAAVAIR
jgi:hypothetical protein